MYASTGCGMVAGGHQEPTAAVCQTRARPPDEFGWKGDNRPAHQPRHDAPTFLAVIANTTEFIRQRATRAATLSPARSCAATAIARAPLSTTRGDPWQSRIADL